MLWLDRIPLTALAIAALVLGFAPFPFFGPEVHLWQKLEMLANGTLSQPIDFFDLTMHVTLPLLLVARLIRLMLSGKKPPRPA